MEKLAKLGQDIVLLLTNYWPLYLNGVKNTLILALVATAIGFVIGLVCGILNTIPYAKTDRWIKRFFLKLIRVLVRIYVEVFRGTPMVLQAVFIVYGLPYFTNNALRFDNIWAAAILIVSINTGAYMAESVRGGIMCIDPGQTEGAKAIGMTHVQTMTSVILPQALRNIMPQIGNNFIINVKDTSVMFIMSFTEFFAAHRYIVGLNNKYFPSATIEMVGYLTMTLIASALLRLLEQQLDGGDSYELAQADQLVMAAGTYSHPDRGTPFDERNPEYRGRVRQALGPQSGARGGTAEMRRIFLRSGTSPRASAITRCCATSTSPCQRATSSRIIGASGSGKSTLLRCINLLETPTSGEILYHGEDVAGRSVNAAAYRARWAWCSSPSTCSAI